MDSESVAAPAAGGAGGVGADVQAGPMNAENTNRTSRNGAIPRSQDNLSLGYAGAGQRVKASGLPEIGPPKRVMLLPEVHPR